MFTVAWLKDAAERVIGTWVEAFLGFLLVNWTADFDLSVLSVAAWSAVPAAIAVLKTIVAGSVGKPDTAAFDRWEG